MSKHHEDSAVPAGFVPAAAYDRLQALCDSQAARLLQADEWISVTQKLPGEQGCDSEEVMVFLNGHCRLTDFEARQGGGWGIRLGYYDAEKLAFRVYGRPTHFVTHWRRLPPPPLSNASEDSTND